MSREDLIELALCGSRASEQTEESADIYVDIAEHLLSSGHAENVTEVDVILRGMTVEAAEAILSSLEGSESLQEGHREIANGTMMDPEGYMALRQIATAREALNRIEAYIGNQKNLQLPAWVQSKMAIASADLDSIGDYFISDTEPTV